MEFPIDDTSWLQVQNFLQQHAQSLDGIPAPSEFLEVFPGTYAYICSIKQLLNESTGF